MNKVIHQANSRGEANHGWLHSHHTFSFAGYHNPDRMGFGKLRVLNDDVVVPSMGFETHPHDNMEIVSIPLSGSLRHQDSMGNQHIIRSGDVQIMSAGTGVTHSEYNNSSTEDVNFLQIWIFTKQRNIEPRYEQKTINKLQAHNQFLTIVSPEQDKESSVWINQDAYLSMAVIDADSSISYHCQLDSPAVYFFILSGEVIIDDDYLSARDGMAVTEVNSIAVTATTPAQVLCIETMQ
ncbi:hypothetical protein A9Q78_02935 [Methylophaga sp. 41_12_T18]|nr:hypothetical protein A9Q78_02935 [Methylophaga sp. 41_12_T18]